jgi:RNA polymerase sigma-70 factor (sigma-E family)
MQPLPRLARSMDCVEETRANVQEQDATKRAFDAHYERLLTLALLLTRDPDEAEDIVQDVFVRSSRKLASIADDETGPYLRAAVVNAWRSRLRRLRGQMRRRPLPPSPSPHSIDPDEARNLWALVVALPPRQRATIVLRYYEDLSEVETAKVLGCSVGTVKSQLSRAIGHLRRRYNDED